MAFGFSVDQLLNPFKGWKKLSRGYRGWVIFLQKFHRGEGLMFPCANGKSEGVRGDSYLKFPLGRGLDIFWNYTISN